MTFLLFHLDVKYIAPRIKLAPSKLLSKHYYYITLVIEQTVEWYKLGQRQKVIHNRVTSSNTSLGDKWIYLNFVFFLVICRHRQDQKEVVQACETVLEYPTWKLVNSVSLVKKLREHSFLVQSAISSSSALPNARQLKDLVTRAFARRSKSIRLSWSFKSKISTLSVSFWKRVTNFECFKTFWSSSKNFVKV